MLHIMIITIILGRNHSLSLSLQHDQPHPDSHATILLLPLGEPAKTPEKSSAGKALQKMEFAFRFCNFLSPTLSDDCYNKPTCGGAEKKKFSSHTSIVENGKVFAVPGRCDLLAYFLCPPTSTATLPIPIQISQSHQRRLRHVFSNALGFEGIFRGFHFFSPTAHQPHSLPSQKKRTKKDSFSNQSR